LPKHYGHKILIKVQFLQNQQILHYYLYKKTTEKLVLHLRDQHQ